MSYKFLPYKQSLALLTDLYEITMAYGYWKSNLADLQAVFSLTFRKNPFKGGFTIACGLSYAIDLLQNFGFDESDISYLGSLKGDDGSSLFEKDFLAYLKNMSLQCDIDAIPEGTVVFPHEPLVRVTGPLIQCQLLETILLNIINFQSLIATKAARVSISAKGDPILEFGPRRAQAFDGALAASRAAYIGGCSSTSNVLAGKIFGIPLKGTHAHSWIMVFDEELEAFKAYAKAMPNNCIFLVDTYDSIHGVKKAVEVGKYLQRKGYKLGGIRLDSGDLAYLSIKAREILDENGFRDAKIIASNNLDETIISSLKEQGAKIDIWGVGTKLITAHDDSALDGVYKLSAIQTQRDKWKYKVKLSEQSIKVSNPGILQVRRYYNKKENLADVIYDIHTNLSLTCTMVDPLDPTRQKKMDSNTSFIDLLVPIFQKGKLIYNEPDIQKIRASVQKNLNMFHLGVKRFVNPHTYPVGIEKSLHTLKTTLILQAKESL